jgi:hypothetical protein
MHGSSTKDILGDLMIEIIPDVVDSAFLYFHTRRSSGDEIAPFVDEIRATLPHTYLWAGDGCIEGQLDDPVIGKMAGYGTSSQRYWFVFPMQSFTGGAFTAATEAMGAVLVTSGGYVNTFVDQLKSRFQISASRIVLCGHQHGACVALATAMMRRADPFALTVLFDPWPLETLYLQHERSLPQSKVVCIDNLWVRERERQRGADTELYKVFKRYGINAEGITLEAGQGKPDEFMFREAVQQIKMVLPQTIMIPNQHLQVLRRIVMCLKGRSIPWVVTGSVGMALQGVPLEVHDIDIQTNKDGAYAIERVLMEYKVKPVRYRESKCIRSHLGMLEIDGIQVEIMGDIQKRLENRAWEEPVNVETYRHWVKIDGMLVPVLSLDYEYQAYLRLGRTEKAEMLRAWLQR